MEPIGKLFSEVYLRKEEFLPDSQRMRNRLAMLFAGYNDNYRLGDLIKRRLGIRPNSALLYDFDWAQFLSKSELRDVLDIVTICFRSLAADAQVGKRRQEAFLAEAVRIMAEEQVGYRVDSQGGVHFAVDQAFELARVSTILALQDKRYNGVRQLFEEAFSALDKSPLDGKMALRSSFFAIESLFRLMFPNAHQLSGGEIQKHLEPLLNQIYVDQKPAIYVAQKLAASLRDWIDGAHFYRHEPGQEEPAQPPLDMAIYIISGAAGHIRWLAALDRIKSKAGN